MNQSANKPAVIDGAVTVVESSALESITRGEIDIQIATAHKFPRSIELFVKRATGMACIDEETAETCLYRRPVGMKDGKQQYAEGMSVRMAEIVAASFGNIRVGAMIIEQTDRQVKARGFAHDLETNSAASIEVVESTVKRDGNPMDERMRIVIAKAALSKAYRDAIFRVVPKALAKPIESAVRKLLTGDEKSLSRRRNIVLKWVEGLKIDAARVWKALGIAGPGDLEIAHLEQLTGIKTAIADNDATIEESFPPIIATGGVGKPGAQGVKPGQTLTEAAGEQKKENPTEEKKEDPKGEPTDEEKKPAEKPAKSKGPSVKDLQQRLIAKGTDVGAGKARILEVAKELDLVPGDTKWDQLDANQLDAIDSAWDDVKAHIRPAEPTPE